MPGHIDPAGRRQDRESPCPAAELAGQTKANEATAHWSPLQLFRGETMKLARIFTLCCALIALGATLCPAAELTQVVRTLEQGYATLNDLQADFSQKSTLAAMKREEKGGGELFIKKGSSKDAMFRFNYTKPKQQIISNGKKVWYYLPEQKQVMVMELAQLFEGGNGVALNYLAGMGHVSKDFNIAFAAEQRDKKGNYLLDLTPKQKSAAMSRVQLSIQVDAVEQFVAQGKPSTPFPIASSTVFDQAGNATRIEFSNVKTNHGLDSGKFNFKVPAGVEIIKNK
jgi:outer membrane lipoprotein carrier protein